MGFKIPLNSLFSWSFSVLQQVAPKRKRSCPCTIKILHLYIYFSTKISGASGINHGSLWSCDIFQCSGLSFLLALGEKVLTLHFGFNVKILKQKKYRNKLIGTFTNKISIRS